MQSLWLLPFLPITMKSMVEKSLSVKLIVPIFLHFKKSFPFF